MAVRSLAVGPLVSLEAENGTVTSPAIVINDLTASGGKAVQFGGSSSCPSTTLNVPDGPDPFGGCFPGPNTSGVPAGITLINVSDGSHNPPNVSLPADNQGWSVSGSGQQIRLNTANAVVDGVSNSSGVYAPPGTGGTIKNSSLGGIVDFRGGTLTIQKSTVYGGSDTNYNAITNGGTSLTLDHVNAHGGGHVVLCYTGCTIQNSYLHDNAPSTTAHENGILLDGGSNNIVTHNSVKCVGNCTADIALLLNDGQQINESISNNLVMATTSAGYCVYPGPNYSSPPNSVSGITWQNNVFQKGLNGSCDSSFGPVYGWFPSTCAPTACIWSGNRWDDGTTLNP